MLLFSQSSIWNMTVYLSPLFFMLVILVRKQALNMRLFLCFLSTSSGWQYLSCIWSGKLWISELFWNDFFSRIISFSIVKYEEFYKAIEWFDFQGSMSSLSSLLIWVGTSCCFDYPSRIRIISPFLSVSWILCMLNLFLT